MLGGQASRSLLSALGRKQFSEFIQDKLIGTGISRRLESEQENRIISSKPSLHQLRCKNA